MSDNRIKKLAERLERGWPGMPYSLIREAADTLSSLSEENARLETGWAENIETCEKWQRRCSEVERENAALRIQLGMRAPTAPSAELLAAIAKSSPKVQELFARSLTEGEGKS